MSRILWIAPKWPLPARDGARRATVALVGELTKCGHQISFLAICSDEAVPSDPNLKELGLVESSVVRRPSGVWAKVAALFSPLLPITVSPFATRSVVAEIQRILLRNHFDLIVYDGLHAAAHASRLGRFIASTIPAVYRAHNCESELWERRAASSSVIVRWFLKLQAKFMRRFEQSLVRGAAATLAVSERDAALLGGSRVEVVPIGVEFARANSDSLRSASELLFIGRLDWAPNREGLIWFLEQVWPKLKFLRSELKLCVAGSGESSWITPYLVDQSIQFLGEIENVSALYDRALISLAPLWNGSGTRVKIIEASSRGCATLSTPLGFEGLPLLPGMSVLQGSSVDEWIEQLRGITKSKADKIGSNARQHLAGLFEKEHCADLCDAILRRILSDRQLQPREAIQATEILAGGASA